MATQVATQIVDCDSHFLPRVDPESLRDCLPSGLTPAAQDMYVRDVIRFLEPQLLNRAPHLVARLFEVVEGHDGRPDEAIGVLLLHRRRGIVVRLGKGDPNGERLVAAPGGAAVGMAELPIGDEDLQIDPQFLLHGLDAGLRIPMGI